MAHEIEKITVRQPELVRNTQDEIYTAVDSALNSIAVVVKRYGLTVTDLMIQRWTSLCILEGFNARAILMAARRWARTKEEFPSFKEFADYAHAEMDRQRVEAIDQMAKALPARRHEGTYTEEERRQAKEAAIRNLSPKAREYFLSVVGEQ